MLNIQQAAMRYGRDAPPFEAGVLRRLLAYHWPGNSRERHNVADRYGLSLRHYLVGNGAAAENGLPLVKAVAVFERALIAEALRQQGGSLARTADTLQIAKTTLYDKMRKYGLVSEPGRQSS